jgi:uncharacterized protein
MTTIKTLLKSISTIAKVTGVIIFAFLTFSFVSLNAQAPDLSETNTQSALKVVSTFMNAIRNGDGATAVSLIDSLVQWDQPGNNRLSGIRKNKNEVLALFHAFNDLSAGTLKLTEVKTLSVNGNSVACLLHWNAAQPVGKILNVDNIDVYTVVDGKIKNVVIYSADLRSEDAFWGKN